MELCEGKASAVKMIASLSLSLSMLRLKSDLNIEILNVLNSFQCQFECRTGCSGTFQCQPAESRLCAGCEQTVRTEVSSSSVVFFVRSMRELIRTRCVLSIHLNQYVHAFDIGLLSSL